MYLSVAMMIGRRDLSMCSGLWKKSSLFHIMRDNLAV